MEFKIKASQPFSLISAKLSMNHVILCEKECKRSRSLWMNRDFAIGEKDDGGGKAEKRWQR